MAPFEDLEYLGAAECPTREELLVRLRHAIRAAPAPRRWGKLELTIARPSSPSRNYEGSLRLNDDLPRLLKGRTCGEIANAVTVIVKIWAREAALPSKAAVVELRNPDAAAENVVPRTTATEQPPAFPAKGTATEQPPAFPLEGTEQPPALPPSTNGAERGGAVREPPNFGFRGSSASEHRAPTREREVRQRSEAGSSPRRHGNRGTRLQMAVIAPHQTKGSSLTDEAAHRARRSSLADEARRDPPLWSLESGASARFGTAPGISIGVLGRLGVALGARSPWSFRLGIGRSSTGTVDGAPAAVWSHLLLASAGSCLRIVPMTRSALTSCVELEAGSFEAGAEPNTSITRTTQISRPWLSAGLSVRAEFSVLRPHLGLWFETGAAIPTVREQLIFSAPEVQVFRTWLVTPWMQLGIKVALGGSNAATPGTAQ